MNAKAGLELRLQRALEVAQNRLDEYNKLLGEHIILKAQLIQAQEQNEKLQNMLWESF